MSAAPRADWVDTARTLAMFFIVWLHAYAAPDEIGTVVGGAIALFFLLAGYFLPAGAGVALVRTGRLALAWLLWSVLTVVLLALAKPCFEFSWERAVGWECAAYNTPLWFLKTLICYQLVTVALLALRVLPRYGWLVVVFLMLCSYTTSPSQHLGIRYNYYWIFLLGFCLKRASVSALQAYLERNWWVLVLVTAGVLVQPQALAWVARAGGLPWKHCSLPTGALAYAFLFVLMAVGISRALPALAGKLAFCGRRMLFIYAAHSFALSPLYWWGKPEWLWNIWVPVLVLPLVALLGWWLENRFPRFMALLLARRLR